MYEDFYGLKQRPFLMTADPDFLYWSEVHAMAYTMLRYGVMSHAPLTVVTGEIGIGKTTLVRHLINEMPDDRVVGLVSNMQEGRGDLLHWVMMSLDQDFEQGAYVENFRRFQEQVIENYAEGRRTVLIFDEAQNMSTTSLEELRMLSNINADKDELLQIVLVGQPQLRDRLRRPEMVQVLQRVAADFHIEVLTLHETRQYIEHRLIKAGARHTPFPPETCALIFDATGGVPRLINSLCDLALVYACEKGLPLVARETLRDFLDSTEKHGIFAKFRLNNRSPQLVKSAKLLRRPA
ncbi:MAG: AAA family ATPase [Pseudomonadota bacterium]